eukprot:3014908-Alexandrium_andersonii.AAC.1
MWTCNETAQQRTRLFFSRTSSALAHCHSARCTALPVRLALPRFLCARTRANSPSAPRKGGRGEGSAVQTQQGGIALLLA